MSSVSASEPTHEIMAQGRLWTRCGRPMRTGRRQYLGCPHPRSRAASAPRPRRPVWGRVSPAIRPASAWQGAWPRPPRRCMRSWRRAAGKRQGWSRSIRARRRRGGRRSGWRRGIQTIEEKLEAAYAVSMSVRAKSSPLKEGGRSGGRRSRHARSGRRGWLSWRYLAWRGMCCRGDRRTARLKWRARLDNRRQWLRPLVEGVAAPARNAHAAEDGYLTGNDLPNCTDCDHKLQRASAPRYDSTSIASIEPGQGLRTHNPYARRF